MPNVVVKRLINWNRLRPTDSAMSDSVGGATQRSARRSRTPMDRRRSATVADAIRMPLRQQAACVGEGLLERQRAAGVIGALRAMPFTQTIEEHVRRGPHARVVEHGMNQFEAVASRQVFGMQHRGVERLRFRIEHSPAPRNASERAAVVDLARIRRDHLPGERLDDPAAARGRLRAEVEQSESIGVVPMPGEASIARDEGRVDTGDRRRQDHSFVQVTHVGSQRSKGPPC